MNGYQITFFTQQDRQHAGKPLADWLMHLAAEMGLRGATLIPGSEGMGHDKRFIRCISSSCRTSRWRW